MTPDDIDALAKRLDADAQARRVKFQWFLFLVPLLWGAMYAVLYLILRSAG